MQPTDLHAWDSKSGNLNVIIETPKGSRNKLKYDPKLQQFLLHKVLPCGTYFPYNFGFIPRTVGGDGDQLDVLVLLDEMVPAGCVVRCRLLGVIEGEEIQDGNSERNDRLIAVADKSPDHEDWKSLKHLDSNLVKEIEHFFATYHGLDGKQFKVLRRAGPKRATRLVEQGIERERRDHRRQPASSNRDGRKSKKS